MLAGGISFAVCKGLPTNELADGEAWLRILASDQGNGQSPANDWPP